MHCYGRWMVTTRVRTQPRVSITAGNLKVRGSRSESSFRYRKVSRKTSATPPPLAGRSPDTSCERGLLTHTNPSGVMVRITTSSGSTQASTIEKISRLCSEIMLRTDAVFIGLRSKINFIKLDDDSEKKTARGIVRNVFETCTI